ncbi:MAG: hypothetical protein OSA11_06720 [Candidatus Nanopelagicales bacterium]|nr:hypothetical protein [Candidatus Nanopelagicales bacterium]
MSKHWKSLFVVLVVLCVGVLVPVAVNSYNSNQEQPEWLMVMKAAQGEFQESTGGDYTLTLTGVEPDLLAFTDRPERQAQRWDITEFLDNWAGVFDTDPPNAVISAGNGEAAITINDPEVSGDTVTFTATPLPGQTLPTGVVNQPTLFIDNTPVLRIPPRVLPKLGHTTLRGDGSIANNTFREHSSEDLNSILDKQPLTTPLRSHQDYQ